MIRMLGSENRQDYVHCRHLIQGRNLITQKTNEQVSSLISSLLEVCPGAILFLCLKFVQGQFYSNLWKDWEFLQKKKKTQTLLILQMK